MAVEAKRPAHTHLSEDAVENYALGRLPKAELASFEEHLLVCERCQEQLAEEDNFAEAMWSLAGMEDAVARGDLSPAPSFLASRRAGWWPQMAGQLAWRKWSAPAWGAAFAVAVAMLIGGISVGTGIVAWKLPLVPVSAEEADAVTLTTLRGDDRDGMAQARALHPLDLSIDLATGYSPGPVAATNSVREPTFYRLEMVDAAGVLQWTGAARTVSGKLTARVEKRLGAGIYWVRLYASSGKLLREFGLQVSK